MTKYLDPNQSAARDRHFKRYFDCGQAMVSDSVQEIRNIRIEFGQWRELTACLLRALEEAASACGGTDFNPRGSAQLTRSSTEPAARTTYQERT
jgi:hypothetical protein